jgi:enoyl-CoA hydratase
LNWAVKLCKKAPVALRIAKAAIRAGWDETETEAARIEHRLWAELFETEEQKEGMRAFIEKRAPVYQGK